MNPNHPQKRRLIMNTKTQSRFFPKLVIVLLTGVLLLSACSLTALTTDLATTTLTYESGEHAQIPVSPTPNLAAATLTAKKPSNTGTEVTFGSLTLVIPSGVASGARSSEYPSVDNEDAPWWNKTPAHLRIMLDDYYILQGKFHQPQIFVYPAQAYAELAPPAFESLHRLNNILSTSDLPISADQLPAVPFFIAQQAFASNIQTISFQNGRGVRFLTEYAQYSAPVNNHELFYHFQGVTLDGAYYIIAIFPITAPVLAETSDPNATLPPGGIVYPDISDPNIDLQGYYTAVTDLLNATSPDTFIPTTNQLDSLINSMLITP
jgi:hypothetical protein